MVFEPSRSLSHIGGVLFDLDDTLYNRDRAFELWTRGFVAEQFSHEDEARCEEIVQQIRRLDSGGAITKRDLFLQARALYPTIPQDVEGLCERFYQEWLVHMVMELETEEMLDALDAAGVPYGIITNGPVQQHLKIDRLRLRHRVRCLYISEEFGCEKPDPAIFRAAAACLGIDPARILFVGDNPEADIRGAKGVGMTAAWLPWGADWPAAITNVRPDFVLGAVHELGALLDLPYRAAARKA